MTAVDMPSPVDRHFGPAQRGHFLGAPFDDLDQEKVLERLGNSSPAAAFRYVVTPNVDHVVRLNGNSLLAPYYEEAWMSLCDSRPITALAHLLSLKLPLVTGSDLTVRVFKSVIREGDLVTLIAANDKIVRDLNIAYPNVRFRAFVPPAGVLTDEVAFRACVDFAARERARFIFIAIGSPQSEKIAHALLHHPDARGTGLCVGAALEFLVGAKKRAPAWMRRCGFEWFHRLAGDPKRLWRRYLYAVIPLLRLFLEEISNRQSRTG
jgi:exopolysaccharide biosynthesis WecB/TagA/CpsF family protein